MTGNCLVSLFEMSTKRHLDTCEEAVFAELDSLLPIVHFQIKERTDLA